jgi:hypothetical protein
MVSGEDDGAVFAVDVELQGGEVVHIVSALGAGPPRVNNVCAG